MFSIILNYLSIGIDISLTMWFSFAYSVTYSLLNIEKYTKYSTKVMFEQISSKDILIEIQKIMENMQWSIVKKDSKQIIFKSSLFNVF